MITLPQKRKPRGSNLCDICGEQDFKNKPCGCDIDIQRRMRVDGVTYEMACLNRAYFIAKKRTNGHPELVLK